MKKTATSIREPNSAHITTTLYFNVNILQSLMASAVKVPDSILLPEAIIRL
jgi:hypothetical protein